jgi:hypothetical protein
MTHKIIAVILVMLLCATTSFGQVGGSAGGALSSKAEEAKSTAQDIKERAAETARQLKEEGLPPGALAALIVIGALAGAAVGILFRTQTRIIGAIIHLIIGGIGAFLAAFAVKVLGLDFGWPRVEFHSETLVLAIGLSIVLVLIFRQSTRQVRWVASLLGGGGKGGDSSAKS